MGVKMKKEIKKILQDIEKIQIFIKQIYPKENLSDFDKLCFIQKDLSKIVNELNKSNSKSLGVKD